MRDTLAGRRSWRLGAIMLAAVSAVVLCGWMWSRLDERPEIERSNTLVRRPVAVAPGVYMLGKSSPSAVYVVESSDGLILIDCGLEADARGVKSQLDELHLDLSRLRIILLTHVHGDHSLGAENLRKQTGARIHAGRADCQPLRDGKPREAFFSTYSVPNLQPHATHVDVELAGNELIELGDARIRVIAAPGHTPGSMCYLLERGGERVLFSGDAIQCFNPPTKGDLGTYAAYLAPRFRGNAKDYAATLKSLRALPPPDLVLPGHPELERSPADAHLTPQLWHSILDTGIEEMERLQARLESDGADFLDGAPKQLLPGLFYLGDLKQTAVYAIVADGKLLLVNAPGGASILDAVSASMASLGLTELTPSAVLVTSPDERVAAGLRALVQEWGCQVISRKESFSALEALCPAGTTFVDAREFALQSAGGTGFELEIIPLSGAGPPSTAYQLQWGGKSVLICGDFPVKGGSTAIDEVKKLVQARGGDARSFVQSLDALGRLQPRMWLPAIPVHGQNANIYDSDWADVLSLNRRQAGN